MVRGRPSGTATTMIVMARVKSSIKYFKVVELANLKSSLTARVIIRLTMVAMRMASAA